MKHRTIALLPILLTFLVACSPASKGGYDFSQAQYAALTPTTQGASSKRPTLINSSRAPLAETAIAPGYLLKLSCQEDSALNGLYRVEFDGTVKLPYDRKLNTQNTSTDSFSAALAQAYAPYFRAPPRVKVSIEERKVWVKAQGLVEKPDAYLIDPQSGLDALVAQAGGYQKAADQTPAAKFAKIESSDFQANVKLSEYYSGTSSTLPTWHGGESVFFQNTTPQGDSLTGIDQNYIHVLGQVRSPGEIQFRDNANFFYYLVQAGGPTDRANMKKLMVVRAENGQVKSLPFSLEEIDKAPVIQGGDVLFVQADNRTDLEKDAGVLGSVGGFLSAVAATILISTGL